MCLAINGKAMAGMRKMCYLCSVFPMGLQALLLSLVNLGNSMARRQEDSLCILVSVSCVKHLLYSLLSEFRARKANASRFFVKACLEYPSLCAIRKSILIILHRFHRNE